MSDELVPPPNPSVEWAPRVVVYDADGKPWRRLVGFPNKPKEKK